jgi:phasin
MEAPLASITEAQGKVRSLVETGLAQTQSKYSQMKSAADEAAHALETSYATIKNGAVELNVKSLEALRATADANFAFFKSVFAVKSPSDYVMLHSEFTRKQIEMMTAHTKAFGELAQKVVVDTVEPIKAQVAKTFHIQ